MSFGGIVHLGTTDVGASAALAAGRLTPADHLVYLLGAATGWDDALFAEPAVREIMTRYLASVLDAAPANWPTVVAALRDDRPDRGAPPAA